jgi:hypothetical protein
MFMIPGFFYIDRYDAKNMGVSHLVYMYKYHITGIVILIIYFTTLVLTFVTMKWDDWLALSPYSVSIKNVSVCKYWIQS